MKRSPAACAMSTRTCSEHWVLWARRRWVDAEWCGWVVGRAGQWRGHCMQIHSGYAAKVWGVWHPGGASVMGRNRSGWGWAVAAACATSTRTCSERLVHSARRGWVDAKLVWMGSGEGRAVESALYAETIRLCSERSGWHPGGAPVMGRTRAGWGWAVAASCAESTGHAGAPGGPGMQAMETRLGRTGLDSGLWLVVMLYLNQEMPRVAGRLACRTLRAILTGSNAKLSFFHTAVCHVHLLLHACRCCRLPRCFPGWRQQAC